MDLSNSVLSFYCREVNRKLFHSAIAQPIHSNIVPTVAQPTQLPMHPPQQPTPQPPQIPGQHVTQGPVMTMAYIFQQQQAFSAPPHAQQIGKLGIMNLNNGSYNPFFPFNKLGELILKSA